MTTIYCEILNWTPSNSVTPQQKHRSSRPELTSFASSPAPTFLCLHSTVDRPCSFGLSATSQQYFSLTTNQPPATSQQYFPLTTNQHQPSATSQTNRLLSFPCPKHIVLWQHKLVMHDESPGVDQHTAYPKARFLRVLTGKLMHDRCH
jgi:hypothetical protein